MFINSFTLFLGKTFPNPFFNAKNKNKINGKMNSKVNNNINHNILHNTKCNSVWVASLPYSKIASHGKALTIRPSGVQVSRRTCNL